MRIMQWKLLLVTTLICSSSWAKLIDWTDNVPSYRKDVAKGDIVNIGVVTPDSKQGLYVPRYVIEGDAKRGIKPIAPDLKTVKDLKKALHEKN